MRQMPSVTEITVPSRALFGGDLEVLDLRLLISSLISDGLICIAGSLSKVLARSSAAAIWASASRTGGVDDLVADLHARAAERLGDPRMLRPRPCGRNCFSSARDDVGALGVGPAAGALVILRVDHPLVLVLAAPRTARRSNGIRTLAVPLSTSTLDEAARHRRPRRPPAAPPKNARVLLRALGHRVRGTERIVSSLRDGGGERRDPSASGAQRVRLERRLKAASA